MKVLGHIDLSANTGKVFKTKSGLKSSVRAREKREQVQSDLQAEINEQNAVQSRMKSIKHLLDRKFNQK